MVAYMYGILYRSVMSYTVITVDLLWLIGLPIASLGAKMACTTLLSTLTFDGVLIS